MNHWFKNSPKIISLALLFSLTFLFACGDSGGSDDDSSDGVSSQAVLNSLTIAGDTVTIDEANKTGSVNLPVGTDLSTAKPIGFTISTAAKLFFGDSSSTDEITADDNERVVVEGDNKFTVLAEDGITAVVYTINVVILSSLEVEAHHMLIASLPLEFDPPADVNFTVSSAPGGAVYRVGKSEDNKLLFLATSPGDYTVHGESGENIVDIPITVTAGSDPSAYIAQVFEYFPGVGQFINTMPLWEEGDNAEVMIAKVRVKLVGGEQTGLITLGGCLGYVTVGFDHTIMNVQGECDFRIDGNAFSGSAEPGVLYVAYDKNKNGQPDGDEWYEIAGSSYSTAENEIWYDDLTDAGYDTAIYRDYSITYHKPETEPSGVEDEYIYWEDNQGNSGWLPKNNSHHQPYYPQWISGDLYTLSGVRLGQNGIKAPNSNFYSLKSYGWGYVDNQPNNDPKSAIDIDWAVDSSGNKAHLPGIDFVKIQCGVNQVNGWLGECSTEVGKGTDLHILDIDIDSDFAQ